MINVLYRYFEKHGHTRLFEMLSVILLRGQKNKCKWLALCGLKYGEGTVITCGLEAFPEPYMVTIGKKVYIASGVTFMTHDGALSWMSRAMGYTDKRTDKMGRIQIKDNCFIGAKATIMQNVTIGNNCIVGMGAMVTKNVPDNSVVAGIPAKVVCTTDEYLRKYAECRDYTCGWQFGKKRTYYENKDKGTIDC